MNPLLLPLSNYGGPTKTHALSFSSPAADVAFDCTAADGSAITTDQRGIQRPQGAACDLGAYEINFITFGSALAFLNALADLEFSDASLMAPLHELLGLLSDDHFSSDRAVCGKLSAFLRRLDVAVQRHEVDPAQAAGVRALAGRVRVDTGCGAR